MTTIVGYARVSTFEQILDLQRDALAKAGCDRIFTDTMSGSRSDRPGLEQALDYLREGDILVVWRLDRLGRVNSRLRMHRRFAAKPHHPFAPKLHHPQPAGLLCLL